MGSESSKELTPSQLDDLKYCTNFTRKEIRDWYKKFHTDCPSGKMSKAEFQIMYDQLFPDGDSRAFSEHVFNAYDTDGNGYIDFREFLTTVNVASRGTIDEKLKWAFNMYDLDGNGYVIKSEVQEIFKSIYKMRGGMSIEQDSMTVDEAVDHLFVALDKNRDEKLSDLEFIIGAKQSPTILAILQPDKQAPE